MRATGCARRPRETQDTWLAERRFTGAATLHTVVQSRATLHDQHSAPACEGFAHGQGIESVVRYRVGCRNLWEGARILQGDALDPTVGTWGHVVIEWLERHGWTDEEPGEETRPWSLDTDKRIGSSLGSAMKAERRRGRVDFGRTINVRASADRIAEQVVAALSAQNTYVVLEGGLQKAYSNPPADTVLGPEYRAGDGIGHAERIFGYDARRDAFLLQGSWGDWTWCRLPDGAIADGCCLVSREVLANAWDIDVVQVT